MAYCKCGRGLGMGVLCCVNEAQCRAVTVCRYWPLLFHATAGLRWSRRWRMHALVCTCSSGGEGCYKKRKRATSLRLMMPSTLDVSGCTTMTRRTLGMLSRSSTTRSWSCRVHTYSRVRLLAGGRVCCGPPSARPAPYHPHCYSQRVSPRPSTPGAAAAKRPGDPRARTSSALAAHPTTSRAMHRLHCGAWGCQQHSEYMHGLSGLQDSQRGKGNRLPGHVQLQAKGGVTAVPAAGLAWL